MTIGQIGRADISSADQNNTGIGRSIDKQLIETHGGNITLESPFGTIERTQAHLQLFYSDRHQRWQSLDSAQYDRSRSSSGTGGGGRSQGRHHSRLTPSL